MNFAVHPANQSRKCTKDDLESEVSNTFLYDITRSNTFGCQKLPITSGQASRDEAQVIPLGGCIEEQLKFHESWILETNPAGLRQDILDVFTAEHTSREGPIVFVAININSIYGRLTGHIAH